MFGKKKKQHVKKMLLEEEKRLLSKLKQTEIGSKEYQTILGDLEKLYAMKRINGESFQKIAPTLIGVAGQLSSIAFVASIEQVKPWVTKAFNTAYKPKIS